MSNSVQYIWLNSKYNRDKVGLIFGFLLVFTYVVDGETARTKNDCVLAWTKFMIRKNFSSVHTGGILDCKFFCTFQFKFKNARGYKI